MLEIGAVATATTVVAPGWSKRSIDRWEVRSPSAAASIAASAPGRTASPIRRLPPPPEKYYAPKELANKRPTKLRLVQVSAHPNQITDDADWWVENHLEPTAYSVPNPFGREPAESDLPATVPPSFEGHVVVKAIRGNPLIAIYGRDFADGRYVLGIDPASGQVRFAFDFLDYQQPKQYLSADREFVRMSTAWAIVEGETLFVSHTHHTYARSSKGKNAFVSAIDVTTGALVWRSQPLVSNAGNFILKEDAIVAGYGFTAEKDYLYVLDKANGRVAQRVAVRSGPSDLVEHAGELYVRTYDTDYVFRLAADGKGK